MAHGGHSHHGDRLTLLQLVCWVYLLFYTQTCTKAEELHTQTNNASTMGRDPPTWGRFANERSTTRDQSAHSLNKTQQLSWLLDLCPTNTCRNRCGSDLNDCMEKGCNCDKRCRLFHDCCPDFRETCPHEATETFPEAELQKHSHYMSYISHDVYQLDGFIKKIQWIRKCPEWADTATVQRCEKPSSFSTSTYLQYAPAVSDGFIFRNKYCAMCHGRVESYALISFSLSCRDERFETEVRTALDFNDLDKAFDLAGQHCLINYNFTALPGNTARFLTYVNDPHWKQCPSQTSEELEKQQEIDTTGICETYQSIVFVGEDQILFNNPHCALCNGISLSDVISVISCWGQVCIDSIYDYEPVLKSFEILIDVASSEDRDLGKIVGSNTLCSPGYIYDDLNGACTPTLCDLGFIANGSTCFRAYDPAVQILKRSEEEYTIVFVSRVSPSFDLQLIELLDRVQLNYAIDELKALDPNVPCAALPLKALSFLQGSSMDSTKCECLIIKAKFNRHLKIYPGLLQDLRSMYDNEDLSLQMFIFNYDISQTVECKIGRSLYSQDVVLYSAPIQQNVFVRNVGFTWPMVQLPMMIYQGPNLNDTYQLLVKVCVEDWEVKDNSSQHDHIKVIVTLVGNVVSLLALFLTLVTFCILPSFKGIVRILLINLIIALFLSQSTFIIEAFLDENTVTCRAVGIFQHYSWLAYFFLMNSTALEMAWGFRSLKGMVKARTATSNRGRLIGLLLYGWISPLILITPSVILDVTDHQNLSPRYGRDSGCWLNNQSALLYFFVIPFSVIVSFNTILILFTAIRIKITASHKHMLSHEQSFFQINLRLSTLMGLSWLLGLIASYTNLEAVWYTFIMLNTLQGLILFFSFAPPQRTVRHLSRRRTRSSRPTQGMQKSYFRGVRSTSRF